MNFLEIVAEVKRLSKAMHDAAEKVRRKAAIAKGEDPDLGADLFDGLAFLEKDSPETDAFRAYLDNLDSRTLNNLVAVMYAGRDRGKLSDALNRQQGFTDEECIIKLEEKVPLPEYLDMGVAQANKEGIRLSTL